ncbi:MAG: hypothetical protein RIR70_1776, partial [Pseudomonadota bacterium]
MNSLSSITRFAPIASNLNAQQSAHTDQSSQQVANMDTAVGLPSASFHTLTTPHQLAPPEFSARTVITPLHLPAAAFSTTVAGVMPQGPVVPAPGASSVAAPLMPQAVQQHGALPAAVPAPVIPPPIQTQGSLPSPTLFAQRLEMQVGRSPVSPAGLAVRIGAQPSSPVKALAQPQPTSPAGSVVVSTADWARINQQLKDSTLKLAGVQGELESKTAMLQTLSNQFGIRDVDRLCAAAHVGSYADIMQLLSSGTDPNSLGRAGMTALHCASRSGRAGVVGFLLIEPKLDPNQVDSKGQTALLYAVGHRNYEIIQMLLGDARVDPNRGWDQKNLSPLMLSISIKDAQSSRLLLNAEKINIDLV